MSSVRTIENEEQFQSELSAAGSNLVIVDYTATWCGPCRKIAPVFESLSTSYPRAVFLRVDVDTCTELAIRQGVNAMPTFIFYRNMEAIEKIQGAEPEELETKLKRLYVDVEKEECEVPGQMDLSTYILKEESECLNESDQHPFTNCQDAGPSYMESDTDEQLIISLTFAQAVKIHSLKFKGPPEEGPKEVKLFINQPRTLDFDAAETNTATQELNLTPKDLEGQPINLKYVNFQNVQNIQLFIKNNQAGTENTVMEYLGVIGSPISTTNMKEFKRQVGKKGESH